MQGLWAEDQIHIRRTLSNRRTFLAGDATAHADDESRLLLLEQAPLPALLNPLAAPGHLPQRQLLDAELEGWRCGRALDHGLSLEAGEPVAVLGPDGNLAGMARTSEGGLLQPKLVFNATG